MDDIKYKIVIMIPKEYNANRMMRFSPGYYDDSDAAIKRAKIIAKSIDHVFWLVSVWSCIGPEGYKTTARRIWNDKLGLDSALGDA